MAEQVYIQVRFTESTAYGDYSDALYFTQEEYASKTPEEINALKSARVAAYIAAIESPKSDN